MHKQWIPGPTFLLPAHSSAKKEGLGMRLMTGVSTTDIQSNCNISDLVAKLLTHACSN